MNKMKPLSEKINLTYVIVASILGFAIIVYGGLNFAAKQSQLALEKQEKQKQEEISTVQRTNYYYKQADLKKCLEEAEEEFGKLMELNSVAAPQENFPDARRWNDGYIKTETEKKLQDDKKLCADLYGGKE